MQRRDFLARLGATVATGGLAGCIGTAAEHATRDDDDPGDANGTTTVADESAESGVELEPPFETDADEPFERYAVGDVDEQPDRAPSHVVFVRNAADEKRSVALAVSAADDDLERSEALPAAEYLEIVVVDPAPVSVVVESDGAMTQTETGSPDGGCSLTVVTISGGGVRTEARSTAEPCTELRR